MEARMRVLFEQHHVLALIGNQRGRRRAAGPAANDQDIARLVVACMRIDHRHVRFSDNTILSLLQEESVQGRASTLLRLAEEKATMPRLMRVVVEVSALCVSVTRGEISLS